MSSLLSRMRKADRFECHSCCSFLSSKLHWIVKTALDHQTIHVASSESFVELSDVWSSLGVVTAEAVREWAKTLPSLTPPYPLMWIEEKIGIPGAPIFPAGLFLRRLGDGSTRHEVEGFVFVLSATSLLPRLVMAFRLCLEPGGYGVEFDLPATVVGTEEVGLFKFWVLYACHVLAKFNCRNVELRKVLQAKFRGRAQVAPTPATVWHEIVLTFDAAKRYTGSGGERDESKMRQFRVRGHYRHAPDHPLPWFRGPFWIPDTVRGNPELGQVIPEYVIPPSATAV